MRTGMMKPRGGNQARGEAHGHAKLTNEQVRDMRRLRQVYGKSYWVLAQIFGCGESTARDITNYYTRIDA